MFQTISVVSMKTHYIQFFFSRSERRITKARIQTPTYDTSYLLLFHDNSDDPNALQCYVIRRLPVLLRLILLVIRPPHFASHWPDIFIVHLTTMTIKTYKRQSKHNSFIIIYYFRATCFDSLESPSGPLMNRPKTNS